MTSPAAIPSLPLPFLRLTEVGERVGAWGPTSGAQSLWTIR